MRWMLLLVIAGCFVAGCEKEIHEARTLLNPAVTATHS